MEVGSQKKWQIFTLKWPYHEKYLEFSKNKKYVRYLLRELRRISYVSSRKNKNKKSYGQTKVQFFFRVIFGRFWFQVLGLWDLTPKSSNPPPPIQFFESMPKHHTFMIHNQKICQKVFFECFRPSE